MTTKWQEAVESERAAGDAVYLFNIKDRIGCQIVPSIWGLGLEWSKLDNGQKWQIVLAIGPFHFFVTRDHEEFGVL